MRFLVLERWPRSSLSARSRSPRLTSFFLIVAASILQMLAAHIAAAESSPRFALLVGVGTYAQPAAQTARVTPLNGPPNDVELMRKLLTEKYGFAEPGKQIVTLRGPEATRSAIESSFRSHLIGNAAKHPGATILFYFSGHGSQAANQSGTEGDELDETLVAYDSRATGGRDIRDKEIADWLKQLRKHTKNITVILDSCHSGDATKDIGTSPIVAKRLPPHPEMSPKDAPLPTSKASAAAPNSFLPTQEYAAISGSAANELSYEGVVLDDSGRSRYHGFLTYFLVRALRRDPAQTYEQLARTLRSDVRGRATSQTPQAEGNVLIPFLGDAADRESSFIPVLAVGSGNRLTVGAGTILGLGVGALVSIYSDDTRRLVGEPGKLANGRVAKSTLTTAEVELIDTPARAITKRDKAVMSGPYPGASRIGVLVDNLPGQQTTKEDKRLLEQIRGLLKENNLVRSTQTDWAIAVQRGCSSGGRFYPSGKLGTAPPNCAPVYYVAPRENRDRALADLIVSGSDQSQAAANLAGYVALRARQDSLRLFDNPVSPLKGKVQLAIVRGSGATESRHSGNPPARIKDQETFQLEVTNTSDRELYCATLVLGTSGRVFLFSLASNGELIGPGKSVKISPAFRAGLPAGLETYKVLATTRKDINFRVLESVGSKEAVGSSSFGMWLKGWSDASAKDPTAVPSLNLDEWVATSIDIEVIK